jgi:hypothetical protein
MSDLLVIRIVPQAAVDPNTFTSGYLNPSGSGLGPLQITAFDLSFDSPAAGQSIGTATYIAPTAGPSPTDGQGLSQPLEAPDYATDPTSGIVQQYDVVPAVPFTTRAYIQVESVATAIIVVPSVPKFENLRIVAQWGSGPGATQIPVTLDYYDVATAAGPAPSLNGWNPNASSPDPWAVLAAQKTSLYLQLPAPGNVTSGVGLSLPSDGTPPPFQQLLSAVQQVLSSDPGAAVTATTTANAPAGSSTVQIPAATAGVVSGMTVSAPAGIPAGATVVAFDPSSGTGEVTLNQQLSADVPSGTTVTFQTNIAALSLPQCQNIAYEIVWSQQPPLPTPPDPVEELYTNPPNTGPMVSPNPNSSTNTPNVNPYEGDRQQFEAELKSYYTIANSTADRLTNFVYALSAAVAQEEQSLAATQMLLSFPANPGATTGGSATDIEVILGGVNTIQSPTNIGIPAGYFYALTANMPAQQIAHRSSIATGYRLSNLLASFTTAINAGTISDAEPFVTLTGSGSINAAQAARRIVALETPTGSSTPLAPLDSVALATVADAPSGAGLTFASTALLKTGMSVSGTNIAPNTKVASLTGTAVTLDTPLLGDCKSGSTIVFTPAYPAGLIALMQAWLAYPSTVPPGTLSSQSYQPGDDDTDLWPSQASAQPAAFLNLVLCVLTQDYMIPPPFAVSLGDEITSSPNLLSSATVGALAAVTDAQWTSFFQAQPTWVPPGPGDTTARIQAFIAEVRTLFAASSGGPSASFVLATSADTPSGSALPFASTTGVIAGMAVSGINIADGTTVQSVSSTSVTLSQPIKGDVPSGSNITFKVSVSGGTAGSVPSLLGSSTDWLTTCLTAYGAFTLGSGFDLAKLQAAAATVFPGDPNGQQRVVDALVALDALYQVMKTVAMPAGTDADAYEFSVIEALYARGFTSASAITEISGNDFPQALIGTVAYDLAGAIYTSASAIAPPLSPVSAPAGFQPINSDGSLTNCVPPPCASPLGPIAYLNEMLELSALSTREALFASAVPLSTSADTPAGSSTLPFVWSAGVIAGMAVAGADIAAATTVSSVTATSVTLSQPITGDIPSGSDITFTPVTLGDAVGQRRGPIGDLSASCANLDTALPLIDIVNESLEYMGSLATTPTCGTVYDTASDVLAGRPLCHDEPCPETDGDRACHQPDRIFAALPQYSTPATPVASSDPLQSNSAVTPAVWNKLKSDFSSCRMPYSQALDVSRTYLGHFGSCRFEEMRTFRKCIREFVFDPTGEPAGFQSYLWRYPVRIDIAIEYLGITPEEYELLFRGNPDPPCVVVDDQQPQQQSERSAGPAVWQLYGFASPDGDTPWTRTIIQLPEFLERTCLSYCEFYELWQSRFVTFGNGNDPDGLFPQCEPCCLDRLWLNFPEPQDPPPSATDTPLQDNTESAPQQGLLELALFIRLWRKLNESCCFGYSFAQLRDICDVLRMFDDSGLNPDFIRQLAAFQMLRDRFGLKLTDHAGTPPPGAIDADRTNLLALWVGPTAAKWGWAVRELCLGIVDHAKRHYHCEDRSSEFIDKLTNNLDTLSSLAGFDPTSGTDNWHALPTHTLRFAEVLEKICASRFRISEILFLFGAADPAGSDDLFPLQEQSEASDQPLDLPDDERRFSLWHLRRELLDAEPPDMDTDEWHWQRIEAVLQDEFGFNAADVLDLGRHFFPHTLQRAGYQVDSASRRFVSNLPVAQTTPANWTTPAGPFQYDPTTAGGQLWTEMHCPDSAVVAQLTDMPALNANEQAAVEDLYFQPKALLALFAVLFPDFTDAAQHLIEDREEGDRWHYFRRHVAMCHHRAHILAGHLSRHVAAVTGQEWPDSEAAALVILKQLLGDENAATNDWENDSGDTPTVSWTPAPNGGAFAALLGLLGTGLVAEYKADGADVVWRDVSGSLHGFGMTRDRDNAPVPTVLPSMNAALTAQQGTFAEIRNGFLVRSNDAALLGGAQGFDVTWSGALLVNEEGTYEFWAGAPTPGHEKPDHEAVESWQLRMVLKRGSRSWVILSHRWPGEEDRRSGCRSLRRGAYDVTLELVRPAPDHPHRQHAGFEVKYAGPDSDGERVVIPHRQLFSTAKDQPLGAGITGLSPAASLYLNRYYTSTFRDIRRTYLRVFMALLFAHRLSLSGRRDRHGPSELGYMLAHPQNFAGVTYYLSGGSYTAHVAGFDFNFLPVIDNYNPPTADSRAKPSQKRQQAMFDWAERLFDYTVARDEIFARHQRQLWHLFVAAAAAPSPGAASLLEEIGVDGPNRNAELGYYQGQNVAAYVVSAPDLEDDRWGVRVWHADRWLRSLECRFAAKHVGDARPDLWASGDPGALVGAETQTGNANLLTFVCDGCFENGEPRRYDELRRLNDGLRERGRRALVDWLRHMDRVPLPWLPDQFAKTPRDLSDLLLVDVDAGIREKASRIDDAITAVHNLVRRARLHLEPMWTISREFAELWDQEFATFHTWQACKRRRLYKENWVEWDDLRRARGVEAFRLLEDDLRTKSLSVAVPGGIDWWPAEKPPARDPAPLQERQPAALQLLPAEREGLNLLGTPERDGRLSWLAAVPSSNGSNGSDGEVEASLSSDENLPYWIEAAMRAGTSFLRIAAAGLPPAATLFRPLRAADNHECVTCCEECGCRHAPLVDEYYFWLIPAEVYQPAPVPALSGAPSGGTTTAGYQYGYQNDFYDPAQQQSAVWQDDSQLAQLLEWQPAQAVRLAWCRIHNGEFQQPRRSAGAVVIDPTVSGDLQFLGRIGDSLTFQVTNGTPPVGYADTSSPGFRYDIAVDDATTLPQVLAPQSPSTFLGTSLPAYPWFLFVNPGEPLLPLSPFVPSLTIARALRSGCRFEPALAWYREVFDPLQTDCTWIDCTSDTTQAAPLNAAPSSSAAATGPDGVHPPTPTPAVVGAGESAPATPSPAGVAANPAPSAPASGAALAGTAAADTNVLDAPAPSPAPPAALELAVAPGPPASAMAPLAVLSPARTAVGGACCDSTEISCDQARDRSVMLHYLETLVEWSDAVTRRGRSSEAYQQSRVILDAASMILGKPPVTVQLPSPTTTATVSTFVPAFPPLNPRLLGIYELVNDRLQVVRSYLNSNRLRDSTVDGQEPYFGSDPVRQGWRAEVTRCDEQAEWCHVRSPYRFGTLIQKAHEHASRVIELTNSLQAAFEKGDAEYLAAMSARHQRELLVLGLDAKKDQWRDADWQVEVLQKTKAVSQANLVYYNGLIQQGLIDGEIAYQDLTEASMVLRTVGNGIEMSGAASDAAGNYFTGVAGFGGSPLIYSQLPIGQPLGASLASIARTLIALADIANTTAGLELTEAGWERRAVEWAHQAQVLTIEIQQIERQILGAQRRRDQFLQELNVAQRQVEQAAEVQDFLRDKFSAHDRYLYLQKETSGLLATSWDLAMNAARQAQQAFNVERGHTTRDFLSECMWSDLHEGLMAGERLSTALHRMEKAYLDENIREYELTKEFSLRLHFPAEFLRLRTTGFCEIEIPEWMYDLDYPGFYMRRIRNMTVTIPCVTGPYTGVNCRLTLLSSMTRIDPRLTAPTHECCCAPEPGCPECGEEQRLAHEYLPCQDDPRIVRQYGACEAIATSTGRNDSGLFVLDFNDPRYVPFEYSGAVCRMRIELPRENNYWRRESLTDLMIRVAHTAREGGEPLRRAASLAAKTRLPGDGWRFLDVRHEFPDAWQLLVDRWSEDRDEGHLRLRLHRGMFPYVPGGREIWIDEMAVFFGTDDCEACCCPPSEGCPCPEPGKRASTVISFGECHAEDGKQREIHCHRVPVFGDLYCGVFDAHIGPLAERHHAEVEFRFHDSDCRFDQVFLVCRYRVRPESPDKCEEFAQGGRPLRAGRSMSS